MPNINDLQSPEIEIGIESDVSSELHSISDLSSIPDTNLHDSYQNFPNEELPEAEGQIEAHLNHPDYHNLDQQTVPSLNQTLFTSVSPNTPYPLTNHFYGSLYLPQLGYLDNSKYLFGEIQNLINQKFNSSIEQFNNYQEPTNLSVIPLRDRIINTEGANKIVNLKSHLADIKHILKSGYLALLEAEKDVTAEITKIEEMKSLSHQLNNFYNLLDDATIRDKFKDITLEAYEKKITDPCFQDKLYVYRYFLDKHRNNIKYLKELNLLNNNPLCPLCFENNISYTCIPCGHTFCKQCLDKCSRCGVCRSEITNIQRIYIL